jgi:hypothetical protein
LWGSSGGGIRERNVAKAEVVKPMRPRVLEVKEVKEVKEVEDSEAELLASWLGKRWRFWRRIMEAKRNMKGTMVMTTAMATRML